MSIPILTTKLFIPAPRTKRVARRRLVERVNAGLEAGHALTLVSAPAGFGKTSLLSEWIAAGTGQQFAWLSLDEEDGDLARFLSHVVAALQTVQPELGQALPAALQSTPLPPAGHLLTGLLNEMAALCEPLVLVLDDYHLVDSRDVDKALTFLVDHQPPRLHLVIAGREDPPLALARLRARGLLTEVRAADLRFTVVEAAEFMHEVMALNLTETQVAALETRTEGWIAGLQLASLALQAVPADQGARSVDRFIESFTGGHQYVLDYLLEEVLQGQPEHIQTFLLRTSILDSLCASLCDAVLGNESPSANEVLEVLERANLFIVALDGDRHWYRYHRLFSDLLRQRLGRPEELTGYHLRACDWYMAHGDLAAAFRHSVAAGDVERAAAVAEAAWPDMDRTFQTGIWLGWVRRLPEAMVRSRPLLCLQLASACSDAGELETSEAYLRDAERASTGAPDQGLAHSLPGSVAIVRAINAQMKGDPAAAVSYAELALRLIPEDDVVRRAQATITLGFTHWATGDVRASLDAMRAWIESMQRAGNPVFAIASAFAAADMQIVLGRLNEAERDLARAIADAEALGADVAPVTAHHHLGLALLAHERGDDAASAEHLRRANDLGSLNTLVDWPYRLHMAQATMEVSRADWRAALAELDEAERAGAKSPVPVLQPIGAFRARIHLRQGRLDDAGAWADERVVSTAQVVPYLEEYEQLTLARVLSARGRLTEVDDVLQRLLVRAEAQGRVGSMIAILVTEALAWQAGGDLSRGIIALGRALALAEPEGYFRLFVDEGAAMRSLLAALRPKLERGEREDGAPSVGYVHRLLGALARPERAAARRQAPHEKPGTVEPLSDRELEILRLVARGLSNAEIGRRLYLALSTVKGHNQRIFAKLRAENRTDAVARAREAGLL